MGKHESLIDIESNIITKWDEFFEEELPLTSLRKEFVQDEASIDNIEKILCQLANKLYGNKYLIEDELENFSNKVVDELLKAYPNKGLEIEKNIGNYIHLSARMFIDNFLRGNEFTDFDPNSN